MTDMKAKVEELIARAAVAEKSEDAMRLSQAACNAANALCALGAAVAQEKKDQKP